MARKPLDGVSHDIVDRMTKDLVETALDAANDYQLPMLRVMSGRCKTQEETACFDEVVDVAVHSMFTKGIGVGMEYCYEDDAEAWATREFTVDWHNISHPILGALIGVDQSTICHSKQRRMTRVLRQKALDNGQPVA